MALRQYVGARYVPKFSDVNGGEWDNTYTYEPLTIVKHGNDYYTSKKYVPVGVTITNTEYWVKTGDYNGAIANLQDQIDEIVNTTSAYVDVRKYGAVLDGATDDTNAFVSALSDGSIMVPSGARVKINNLSVPDFRTIDFNGSFVYSDHYAIKCLATVSHGYVRNITIKNAHFITPDNAGAARHTYGGVYLDGAIKCRIINSELANCNDGTDFCYIRNSFNISIDNCYCGTGNSNSSVNSSFITFYGGNAIIPGSNNITNCNITNALVQRIERGIYIDMQNGLFDTNLIDNIGFSYVDDCIENVGGVRNISANNVRCEFCAKGITNVGYMSVSNVYFTRTRTYCISNTGTMIVSGNIIAFNPTDYDVVPLYINSGQLNTINSLPTFLSRVNLNNTGTFNKPVIKDYGVSDFIDNSYKLLTVVTGTTPSESGSTSLAYPAGFGVDNTVIVSCRIYRSNNTWVSAQTTIASSGIIVVVPEDPTLYNRGIEVCIIKKTS